MTSLRTGLFTLFFLLFSGSLFAKPHIIPEKHHVLISGQWGSSTDELFGEAYYIVDEIQAISASYGLFNRIELGITYGVARFEDGTNASEAVSTTFYSTYQYTIPSFGYGILQYGYNSGDIDFSTFTNSSGFHGTSPGYIGLDSYRYYAHSFSAGFFYEVASFLYPFVQVSQSYTTIDALDSSGTSTSLTLGVHLSGKHMFTNFSYTTTKDAPKSVSWSLGRHF